MAWRQHGPGGCTLPGSGQSLYERVEVRAPLRTPAPAEEERRVLHKEVDPHSYVIGL